MPEAVTTWRESLWIGPTSSSLDEVRWVTASPEVGKPNSTVDATSFDSDAMTYIVGLPDYSDDLVWELNAQHWTNVPGNLRYLLSLDGQEVFVERRMPLVGVRVAFKAIVHVSTMGAEVNALQKLTLRATPTTPATVSQWTRASGYAMKYYSSCYIAGVLVNCGTYTQMTSVYQGGSIGGTYTVRSFADVTAPEGYVFSGWCEDAYGDGRVYQVGDRAKTLDQPIRLYPYLKRAV